MKRLQRLDAVRNVMQNEERRQAAQLADCEHLVANAALRLQELERYRSDYAQQLDQRATQGIDAMALRDYQAFLARLEDAIVQQSRVHARVLADLEFERSRWQAAAIRLKSMSTVIEKWESEERVQADRMAQIETDERAAQQTQRFAPEETSPGLPLDG